MVPPLDVYSWLRDDASAQISPDFYNQVLNVRSTTAEPLRYRRIGEMVLKQALNQLDPNQYGMSLNVVECMPPSRDGMVRSLRESLGSGTAPWDADLEQRTLFLGMESLAGYCVEIHHVVNVDNLQKESLMPVFSAEFEVSSAAYPIWLGGRIAGCLRASSTQPDYFTQPRLSLLTRFSDLISLAFDEDKFYPPHVIELRAMPTPEEQRPVISSFRSTMRRISMESRLMSMTEVQLKTWQEIEATLLDFPPPTTFDL